MEHTLDTNGVVRLAHWGVIRARGADAARFLHGQLTSDMLNLGTGRAVPAGFCSAKGRLQASFIVWAGEADEILLAGSASLLAPTLKRLSMFVMRAQCKLDDATAELPLHGLAGPAALALLGDAQPWECRRSAAGTAIRLPDAQGVPRAMLAGTAPSGVTPLDADTWRWLEVSSGVPVIEASTVDQFVPQMVNFELVGGVNFKKGCYPGQEVVARSQYRGTLKRRGTLLRSPQPMAAGQEVYHSADPGQPAGTVALAAGPVDGAYLALTELKLAALQGGSLHLGAADGATMTPAPLPYELPSDGP